MTEITEKKARYKISNILEREIVAVRFSEQPKIYNGLTDLQTENGHQSPETEYEVQTGCIHLELDNGLILSFWNSDAGGMTITKKECVGLPDDQVDDMFEFKEDEDA